MCRLRLERGQNRYRLRSMRAAQLKRCFTHEVTQGRWTAATGEAVLVSTFQGDSTTSASTWPPAPSLPIVSINLVTRFANSPGSSIV
mmetsp:Transcript_74236/g.210162  ORF Transcript_74236/g.210162 Transcript_74236/m.210162 type:complete len:87 (-) Transcript_74236:711-971(-)